MMVKGSISNDSQGVPRMLNFRCNCCKGSGKNVKVSFCPKCKSRDVKYIFGFGNLFGVIPKMRCGNCGNEMLSFPILTVSKKALSEMAGKVKKKKIKKAEKKLRRQRKL